jgi:uncharacterized protein (TIGR03437 family)
MFFRTEFQRVVEPGAWLLKTICFAGLSLLAIQPLAAQSECTTACQQFISTTDSTISSFMTSLAVAPNHTVVMGGNLFYAIGSIVDDMPQSFLLNYIDGMKAAGAQRLDINPGVTSINDPAATALYDAVVQHMRALGMQLAINPEVDTNDVKVLTSFQDFQTMAMTTYPALAQRYHPDNFVIVHEPTTQDARLNATPTTAEWHSFVLALSVAIKKVSPNTRVGTGGFYDAAENTFFQDLATIPNCSASTVTTGCTDFMTMDIYDDNVFTQLDGWIQLAKANGKGIYIEETWAPKYLPATLPPGWQSNPGGLDAYTLVGTCDVAFATEDVDWLQAMTQWASANGLEAITPFTTAAFFYYGNSTSADVDTQSPYVQALQQAVDAGQTLTASGKAYVTLGGQNAIKEAISVSSASYATLPTVFNPTCGPGNNPCNAETIVAPDELVTAFGTDLATTTKEDGTFPTNLGGTTGTIVDIGNTSYPIQFFFVSATQVSYYVPANVQAGPATVTIKSSDGTVSTGVILIQTVMPGLYTANANGQGAPAAYAVIQHADGSRTTELTATCTSAGCTPATISLASTDQLYLELYGTGIRHVASLSAATATANGQSASVQYAGAAPGYTGEDQVNIQIPTSLNNAGTVNVVLTVGGQAANTVTLDLE